MGHLQRAKFRCQPQTKCCPNESSCFNVCPASSGTHQPFSAVPCCLRHRTLCMVGAVPLATLALLQRGFPLLPADLNVTGFGLYPGSINSWRWMPGLQEVGSTGVKGLIGLTPILVATEGPYSQQSYSQR